MFQGSTPSLQPLLLPVSHFVGAIRGHHNPLHCSSPFWMHESENGSSLHQDSECVNPPDFPGFKFPPPSPYLVWIMETIIQQYLEVHTFPPPECAF